MDQWSNGPRVQWSNGPMSQVSGIVYVIVFVIVFVFVFAFVIVFLLVRSCPLITQIKCLKCHKSLRTICYVPSTLEISIGLRPQEMSRVSGNLTAVEDGFPHTSLILVAHGYNPC